MKRISRRLDPVPCMVRRTITFLFVTAGVSALLGGPARADAVADAQESEVASTGERIAWSNCGEQLEQLECADVWVPLDWDRPDGPEISLPVIRHLASRPKRRIGSLFVNFGGPGVAGVATVREAGAALDALGEGRFDVVGWDPRGTGESTHVRCFANDQNMARFWGENWTIPTTRAASRRYVLKTVAYARRCAAMSGSLLEHISTADTVRDLDHLRALVGDRRLTYRGLSYGTFLGQTYANMFPDRVRAMILDAVLDPVAFTTSVEASIASAEADGELYSSNSCRYVRRRARRIARLQGRARSLRA